MAEDGDDLSAALAIAGIIGAATGLAQTGLALSKGGGPKLPKVQPPAAPPPPPPPPQPLPPAPTATQADTAVERERRRQQRRYGIANTLLTSPLGGATGAGMGGRTLLGG